MTPLDTALEKARKSGKEEDQGAFYTLLVNSLLLVPVWDVPGRTGERIAGEGEAIKPVIIDRPDGSYLMLFDSEERLAAWADREVGFVGMNGADALKTFGTELRWCLNVGTDYMKVFVPEELAWLASNIETAP